LVNWAYETKQSRKEGVYKKYEPDIIVEIKAENFVSTEYLFKKFHFDRARFSKYSKAINSYLTVQIKLLFSC